MKVTLHANGTVAAGGSSLIMHNEQLADPLNEWTRLIAAISKKRNKTEADHMEIARLEFLGGLYTNENGPCLPAWNVLRCLQDGATRHKRGRDVLRGIYPLTETTDLAYSGDDERVPDNLWKLGGFSLRKTVGVQRSRTVRTRPIFNDWKLDLEVEVDPVIFDLDSLQVFWKDAGTYAGLGDMRPVYGRFAGTLEEVA
jgi:hypothetical protein